MEKKEELQKLLVEIEGVITRSHAEILNRSANVKEALRILDNKAYGLVLLNVLSKELTEKFRALLVEELGSLSNSEIKLKGLAGDIMNIIHDVDDGKVSKSTRRLLGRVHMDCTFHGAILVQSVGEMTGMAHMLIKVSTHIQ